MKLAVRGACLVLALACRVERLEATVFSFGSSKDNTLYEDPTGTTSNGAGAYIFAGDTASPAIRRGLIAFDIANALPSDTTINSGSLTLYMSRSQFTTVTVGLHRADANWGEGASDAGDQGGGGTTALPGDATWLNTFYNTGTWSNAGGDFSAAASSSSTVGSTFGFYSFPSTATLITDVHDWLTAPQNNFGWVVVGDESTFATAKRFNSRQNPDASTRPKLSLDVTLTANTSLWNDNADLAWGSGAWIGGVPDSSVARAFFGSAITAPRTITLDSPRTVGKLTLTGKNAYTIAGPSTLTVAGGPGAIELLSGAHFIQAPIAFNTDATLSVSDAAGLLRLSGDMSSAALVTLTKSGPGALELKHARTSSLHIDQGSVKVLANGSPSGTSLVETLSIFPGSWLDLTDNDLVLNYTGPTPAPSVRARIMDGRIRSSLAIPLSKGLGYGDNVILHLNDFDGFNIDVTSVLVKYTFLGDANLDGQVNISDLLSLATHYHNVGGEVWTSGDFNYDGSVDGLDLALLAGNWQAGVGNPLSEPLDAALEAFGLPSVPEPTAILLAPLLPIICRPRRRQ